MIPEDQCFMEGFETDIDFKLSENFSHCLTKAYTIWQTYGLKHAKTQDKPLKPIVPALLQ